MTLPMAPFTYRSGRRGMVATADHLAAGAGLDALRRGGSAADAIVAAAAAMAVIGPHLCGLGGDVLAVVCPPGRDPEGLLSIGRAGAGSDVAALRARGLTVMPLRGDLASVTVPGAVDGWLAILARYGRLPTEAVFAPAIELAEGGFPASLMLSVASHLISERPGAEELCPGGRPLEPGRTVRLPGIARTLRAIAAGGRDAFYGGEFGQGLRRLGQGAYADQDFERDLAEWCEPVRLDVWGHRLWTVPPPSQGFLGLAGSAVAERVGLGTDPTDPQWAHLIVEASRAVGHDRPDVLFDGADGAALVADDRLDAAAARISPDRTAPPDRVAQPAATPAAASGVPTLDGDTTYLCAVDADGFGISLIQSNALDFGSHLIEPSTGIFLHNRGLGFSLEQHHPAELSSGRRPPHTLSPLAVTTSDGTLTHVMGAMGGDSQPQILLQLVARLLHAGQDPATAVAAPRLALSASAPPFRLWWGDDLHVLMEADAPDQWVTGLAARGHDIRPIRAFNPTAVGCAQIIEIRHDETGPTFRGAADPRSPEGGVAAR